MMRYIVTWVLIWILGWVLPACPLCAQDSERLLNRYPVFAGTFYPPDKKALEAELASLFSRATQKELPGKVRCLIVPHAGYSYSGIVAASAYKSIPADAAYKNIFIIATSHRESFDGASVYSKGHYVTPLGLVRVNLEIAVALVEKHKNISFRASAHDREHSIEVQLPMIQNSFAELPPIVPIVIGTSSVATARDLAAALLPYFTPENLFVVSTDFSHYPSYGDAVRIDELTGDAILRNNPELFYSTLRKNSTSGTENLATPCCGWSSVMTLLYLSSRNEAIRFSPILYKNSGDASIGDKERVVGYWAIAGHEAEPEEEVFLLEEKDKLDLLEIARKTLVSYLVENKIPEIAPDGLSESLRQPAGAFVSLFKHGELRGCIGNFIPDEPLYRVVQEMSIASATRDKRFYPVESGELEHIGIEISVLTPLRRIESVEQIELGRHGIYMRKDGRSGTYLPQVAGQTGWTREEFLGHCARDKAGIGWDGWKEAELFVYEAIVFSEEH
jgi:AmmeMemoRadiSam system protein B/AmmeMemoRadiSam system protein A